MLVSDLHTKKVVSTIRCDTIGTFDLKPVNSKNGNRSTQFCLKIHECIIVSGQAFAIELISVFDKVRDGLMDHGFATHWVQALAVSLKS